MTTRDLHRAVARATGEDVETIATRGFSLVDDGTHPEDDDLVERFLDWDELEAGRPRRCVSAA